VNERPEILILNGPNLNMLGVREPQIYGRETLGDIEEMCIAHADALGLDTDFRQSNVEGELVTMIQASRDTAAGIIINGAAYTHTSVAIQDALKLSDLPVIEVHLSNVHQREPFRHHSYISAVAKGIIVGFGSQVYTLALDAMARLIEGET
jgi:3-dehydroquinate dehydratase II